MKRLSILLSVVVVAAVAGCSNSESSAKPAEAKPAAAAKSAEPAKPAEPVKTAQAKPAGGAPVFPATPAGAEAKQLFEARCVICHGANGQGDGVSAAALNPKPRAYADKAWQASVTDEHIAKAIVEGGAAVGKSALMPPNPDLAAKKEVVDALVAMIRNYGK